MNLIIFFRLFFYFVFFTKYVYSHGLFIDNSIPQQVHLSFGSNPLEIFSTWTTYNESDISVVQLSELKSSNISTFFGDKTRFVDGGNLKRVHYIHRVLINKLKPQTQYKYRCGSGNVWSDSYTFKTFTLNPNASPEILLFGDLGLINGQSISRLRSEVLTGNIDAILHVGDIAYNMDDNNSYVGDAFMRIIEPIAAHLPYQTCVGNHEQQYNFSNYNNRFTMVNMFGEDIGMLNNYYYSFYMGPALFIGFSTEFYFFTNYGTEQIANQYRWLEKTLQIANKPENRAKFPWIITFAHRPMYCSNLDSDDCTNFESVIRTGFGPNKKYPLEILFHKYGVDVEIWAHEHSYERFFPLFDGKVYNGTNETYHNPGSAVHIITGAAGCDEFIDNFVPKPPEWSAVRISDYGYTRMNILNSTHLRIRQISDDKMGRVMDDFTIIKDFHQMRKL